MDPRITRMNTRSSTMRFLRSVANATLGVIFVVAPVRAGAQGSLDDYRRAATVTQRLAGLTANIAQSPTWTEPTRFWYRKSVKGGNEFVVVDAATGQKRPAFDHARLATALSSASGTTYAAVTLPFSEFTYTDRGDSSIDVD